MQSTAETAVSSATESAQIIKQVTWGRASKIRWSNNVGALFMVACSPLLVHLNWAALQYFDGSLTTSMRAFASQGLIGCARRYFPQPSFAGFVGYTAWILCQALLYAYLPGTVCSGQRTPGGNLLRYTTNGLSAWMITHLLFLASSLLGLIDASMIAKHWQGLFVAANVYGFLMSIFVQCKGYWFPTFPEDCKLSGSWIFDFWAGVELNPRFGKHWDFKFFHNGRPGMLAWTLINLSWAEHQRQMLGYVTTSMLIVIVLQTIYVVDFFINEDWYTRTIDISHDHFGFMLAWGDTTFLPTFYTLQAQFLARYPTHLSTPHALAILLLGLSGYIIFRWANHERDYVRSRNGNASIWGRPATFIQATYLTDDGKEHHTILITSGWWGVCRHANYLADLLLSAAMCATCGFTHVLPWSYFIFMCIFLRHRAERDEQRCSSKYGVKWEEYCQKVPYRIIPAVY